MNPGLRTYLLLLLTFSKAHAQPLFRNPSVSAYGYAGSFLTHHPKAQYLRDSYSYFGELSVQQQTDGRKDWQIANRFPQTGLALHFGNTGSRRYMGSMAAVFPFVKWTLLKQKGFTGSLRAGAGLGWVQKPYDKISNHKSVLIGSHGNVYIHLLWQAEVRLSSAVYAAAGLGFSHLSNGSTTLPNLGLNIPTLSLGLRYQPHQTPTPVKRLLPFTRKTSLALFTTAGIKQFPWIESRRYAAHTLQGEWSRRFRASGSYNAGVILFYDHSLEVNPNGIPDQKRRGNKLQAGVVAGYEHHFGRLSVPVQLGAYVYNNDIYSALFQQLAFRYRINSTWSAQLAMKTHSGKVDFIHAGIGYFFK